MDPANDTQEQSEVLSQSEVERLLAEVSASDHSVVVHQGGEQKSRLSKETIQPYDFRNPVFLSQADLRKLRLHHEEFIKNLASRLSMYLRLEITLQMSKLHTIPFEKFTEGLNNPGYISVFKLEPLRGLCVLELHPRLGLTMVDRMMGGPAHSINHEHDLSDIEHALLEQVVGLVMSEWCGSWAGFQELRPKMIGTENNGRFLQTAPHDTIFLAMTLEARVGDCMEQMQIGVPFHTIEPLIRRLSQNIDAHVDNGPTNTRPAWNPAFDEVPVPVTAEWQGLELTAGAIASLRAGDVLKLDPSMAREVKIRLSQITKFNGSLGTRDGRWAVQIGNVLKHH
jgi:flagellar motor switch protein FliM